MGLFKKIQNGLAQLKKKLHKLRNRNPRSKVKNLTLRQKTLLIVSLTLIGLLGALYVTSSIILYSSMRVAEEQNTRQAVESVVTIFAQTLDDFSDRFPDWSAWDDTYNFVKDIKEGKPTKYIESNLTPEALASMKINLVLYFDSSGWLLYGTGLDIENKKTIPIPEALQQHVSLGSPLLRSPESQDILTGLLLLPEEPMLLTSQPILTSKGSGPVRGTLMFGRYLDTKRIQKLASRYHLTVHEINETKLPPDFLEARSALLNKHQQESKRAEETTGTTEKYPMPHAPCPMPHAPCPILVRPLDKKMNGGYTLINDIYGKPALLLRVDVPRDIYQQGITNLHYLFTFLVIVSIVLGAIAQLGLEKLFSIQQKRRESEIRYRVVVTQASDGIFLIDADTKQFLEGNAALEKLLGYPLKELLKLTLYDVVLETRQKLDRHIQTLLTVEPLTGEQQYRCRDGRIVDVEVNVNQITYADREVLCVIVRDITSRKQAEIALRQQAEAERLIGAMTQRIRQSLNLEEILNTTVAEVREFLQADRVVIYRCQPEIDGEASPYEIGIIIKESVNPNYPSMLGQSIRDRAWAETCLVLSKQGQVRAIEDIYSANLLKIDFDFLCGFQVKASLIVPIQQGDDFWGLLVAHQCSGTRQWQQLEIGLLKQLATQVGIAIQQSELYHQVQQFNAELEHQVQERTQQLQRSLDFEAMLKRITDKVRDSLDESQILHTAVQELALGLGVDCCDTALYDLELGTSTIVYEHVTELPPAQGCTVQMADFPEIYPQLLQGKYVHYCEIVSTNIRPLRQRVAILACPIFDDGGVLGDLWLYSKLNQAFSEAEIRLVKQVTNQCAIAIRQARLYQTTQAHVEELERLNRLKDDFLSTISHELRTPMSSIKMATQMLEINLKQVGILEPESNITRYFKILQTECQREIQLINDLLDLSRLDADAEPLVTTTIEPENIIFDLAEIFRERARNQNQQLEVEIPDELPVLNTDSSKLERILNELVNNACKYTPAGERITIKAHAQAETLQLSVSNSGVDIPQSELSRIFEKFYRIPNNNPWKHGGTGLGLALVQKLVTYLGGSIHVKSSEGEICFTVELPI